MLGAERNRFLALSRPVSVLLVCTSEISGLGFRAAVAQPHLLPQLLPASFLSPPSSNHKSVSWPPTLLAPFLGPFGSMPWLPCYLLIAFLFSIRFGLIRPNLLLWIFSLCCCFAALRLHWNFPKFRVPSVPSHSSLISFSCRACTNLFPLCSLVS